MKYIVIYDSIVLLYCTVLYCTVLYCSVLYCSVVDCLYKSLYNCLWLSPGKSWWEIGCRLIWPRLFWDRCKRGGQEGELDREQLQ